MTNTFSQSGNLGDLIYSLAVIKKMGGGDLFVKLHNVPNIIRKYNNGPVAPEYQGRLSEADYGWLEPLLLAQEYIHNVKPYTDENITVDLDDFRGVLHKTVKGNFLKALYTTHNIPFTEQDLIESWLTVPEPQPVAKFVVSRSHRWRSLLPNVNEIWKELIINNNLSEEGIFIGNIKEHADFESTFGISIKHHMCKDFLELAQVISGAQAFFGNQSFPYSVAQGLGKTTILESFTIRPLPVNECFFDRSDCYYF